MIINPYLVTAIGGGPPNPLTIAYDADNIQISGINGDVPNSWNDGFAEDGIQYFSEGGNGTLIIPSELAFGDSGSINGTIPGGAVLIFDIDKSSHRTIYFRFTFLKNP